ncbi:low affinity potassium transporter [Savitreella phatthalungensis]
MVSHVTACFTGLKRLVRRFFPLTSGSTTWWNRIEFDFITIHYTYIITSILIGSLLVFSGGGIRYIDALFLASSSCTQAGLNPVNLNQLNTWQQVAIFLLTNFTNPIVIHSATAFIRLYWFRKRFEHIVRETNMRLSMRRTRSRAVSIDHEERGVNGREIRVLFHEGHNPQTHIKVQRHLDAGVSANGDGWKAMQADRELTQAGDTIALSTFPLRTRSIAFKGSSAGEEFQLGPKNENSSSADSDLSKDLASSGYDARTPSNQSSAQHDLLGESAIVDDDEGDEYEERHRVSAVRKSDSSKGQVARSPETSQAACHIQGSQRNAIDDDAEPMKQGQDIRFAKLPIAQRGTVSGDPGTVFDNRPRRWSTEAPSHASDERRRNESFGLGRTIASTLLDIGARTMTMDTPRTTSRVHHRRPSASRSLALSTTIERAASFLRRRRNSSPNSMTPRTSQTALPYISFQPTIGRNSAFVELTSEQRDELGGIEYRATKTLCKVLVCYFFGFHIFGFICYIAFIYTAQQYGSVVLEAGAGLGWWSIFSSFSAMNDLGLTLTPDSYNSFQRAAFLLVIASFLIVIGNTGFPCMLRFVIWLAYKMWPHGSPTSEELAFLLDHPRRCFTLLFPSAATWWLFGILVGLNALDLILFIILDLNNPVITDIPAGYRWLVGLFQAFSTRTAGFTAVNLSGLHSAVLVSYMIMMYVSVFPVAISIRRTNVYEERSLGIYTADEEQREGQSQSFVGTHIRRQLGFDLWYIFLALFIICIIENPEIQDTNLNSFNIFNILFEIISAYGTVGLSLGYPGVDFSFSGVFHTLSKLVVIALEIRGRHRGLPLKLDRAVLLPSDRLIHTEEEDHTLRRSATTHERLD